MAKEPPLSIIDPAASPARKRHLFPCQLRWADVDSLGHVNNVAFAGYLQEARRDLVGRHPSVWTTRAGGLELGRLEVTYLTPLVPTTEAQVVVESRTGSGGDELVIDSEIVEVANRKRTVVARGRALARPSGAGAARHRSDDRPQHAHRYPAAVRFSDLDGRGKVGDTSYFEYLQEARIALMADLGLDPTSTVVAQKNVDFLHPAVGQPTTYDVWTLIARVGNRSVTFDSVICHGDVEFARASVTLVFFDPRSQRSVAPSAATVAALRALQLK